jgi:hypothetical protein
MSSIRRTSRIGFAVALAATCWFGRASAQEPVDVWLPGLTVAGRFDQSEPSTRQGRWIGVLAPRVGFQHSSPFADWVLSARRSFYSYENSMSPTIATDVASLRVLGTPSEHTEFGLWGHYLRSRDPILGDPRSTLTSGASSTASGSARLLTWRSEMGYRARGRSFDATDLVDGAQQSWNATLFPARSQTHAWLVSYRGEQQKTDKRQVLRTNVGTAGFRHSHTEFLSSELEVGVASVSEAGRDKRNELAGQVGLTGLGRALGLPFDARFRVIRDAAITGVAEIWRDLATSRIAVRYDRDLDSEGGAFNRLVEADMVTAELNDTIAVRTTVTISGSYRHAEARTGPKDQADAYRALVSVDRDIRPWLNTRLAYSYVRQDRSATLLLDDFRRHRVEVGFTLMVP